MAKHTITPWRSRQDLLQVRSQLYRVDRSATDDQRRHAVDRVMAWKLRGNLPHAVESTALLVDATLHHGNSENSIFSVRAVYSAAFTRFVTGFCDIGRSKERSLEPSSMLDIAKQIGMPVEFVALRHEATHEELPAVQRLVKATDDALRWLWTVYWSRLEEPEGEEDVAASIAQVKADARQILRGFRSRRRDLVKAKKHRYDFTDIRKTLDESLEFFGNSTVKMEAFVSVLIHDKLLSPSKREIGDSMQGAYVIWDELLKFIVREQKRFAMMFIKVALEAISGPSPVRPDQDVEKEALCSWIIHILYSEEWLGTYVITTLEKRILRKDAMRWCCMHPGHWTHHLGKKMFDEEDDEDVEDFFTDDWRDIFEASQLGDVKEAVLVDLRAPSPGYLNDVSHERFSRDESRKKPRLNAFDDDDDAELGNWVRAATPFAAPIGVVR